MSGVPVLLTALAVVQDEFDGDMLSPRDMRMLEIAARAERDRIREFARHHNVRIDMGPTAKSVPFADQLDKIP